MDRKSQGGIVHPSTPSHLGEDPIGPERGSDLLKVTQPPGGSVCPLLQVGKRRLSRLHLPKVTELVKGRAEIPTEAGFEPGLPRAEQGLPQSCRAWRRSGAGVWVCCLSAWLVAEETLLVLPVCSLAFLLLPPSLAAGCPHLPHGPGEGPPGGSCILGATPRPPFLEMGNRSEERLGTWMCLGDPRDSRAAGQSCREDVAQPCGS